MIWALLVFCVIYVLAPLVCATSLRKMMGGRMSEFLGLVAASSGPLLVALLHYGLLAFLPQMNSWVYLILISMIMIFFAWWSRDQLTSLFSALVHNLSKIKKWVSYGAIFVIAITIFVFIRSVIYPPTWGDVYEYIEQSYVYSQDKGLSRFNTSVPFTADSTYFTLNNAIRPGLPMLYSLFFMQAEPTPYLLSITHFVYFYYFVLLLLTVSYGGRLLGLKRHAQVWPIVLLLSSFYILRFTIFGGKEIILMELALLSLYSLYELGLDRKIRWEYLIMLSLTMGMGCFVNLSGTIVAGIIGLIFIWWVKYPIKLRLLATVVLAILTIVFGGFEPWNGGVSFILNPILLSQKSVVMGADNLREVELSNYQLSETTKKLVIFGKTIDSTKLNVLLKGKLQAFTQPQYFGFIFYIWLTVTLLALLSREKFSGLDKLLLTYVTVYFIIIMDPFFLNPHKYAYVLAISPKYSLMLVPMIAILISSRWKTIENILIKIPKKLPYYAGILAIFLIPSIRAYVVSAEWKMLASIISFSRDSDYYLLLLNYLMIGLAMSGILICLSGNYWGKHLGRLAIITLIIMPTIILLNTNFAILETFRYMFSPLPSKMTHGFVDQHNKEVFTLVNFINIEIPTTDSIIFLFRDNRIGFFIQNRNRIRMPINGFGLTHLKEHLESGDITAKYFVYTSAEADEPILQARQTREVAKVGPYLIREITDEQ